MSNKFAVGDRVKIHTNHRAANGKEGVITAIDPTIPDGMVYMVDFPGMIDGYIWNFGEDELELIVDAPPASPPDAEISR